MSELFCCEHGNALFDHADEVLHPSCGCGGFPALLLSNDFPRLHEVLAPVQKQCWWNAIRAANLLQRKKIARVVRYVEGWAIMDRFGIPFEHGWVTLDGKVYETTLDHRCPRYFPAAAYTPATARKHEMVQRSVGMPITGWPGLRDPSSWRRGQILSLAVAMRTPIAEVEKFLGGALPPERKKS